MRKLFLASALLTGLAYAQPTYIPSASTGFSPTAPYGASGVPSSASTGYSSAEPFGDNNGSVIDSASTGFSPTRPFGRYSPKVIGNASDGYSPTAPFRDNPSYIPPATQGYSSTTPFGGYNNGTVIEPASTGFSPTQPFGDNNGAYIEPATQARVRQSSQSSASQQSLRTYFARRRANPSSFQPYEHPINESGYPSMQSGSGFPTVNY